MKPQAAPGAAATPAAAAGLFSPARFLQTAVSTVANVGKAPRPVAPRSNAMDSGPWQPVSPTRPAPPSLFSDNGGDDAKAESAEDLLQMYKALDETVAGHNLTSVLSAPSGSYIGKPGTAIGNLFGGITIGAGGGPLPSGSASETGDRPMPSIIPTVTMEDFKAFRGKTDERIKRFFSRPSEAPRAGVKQESAKTRMMRQQSSKAVEEDPAITLKRCYDTIPAVFFNMPFDPITDDDEVVTLVDTMHRSRASLDDVEGADIREEFEERKEKFEKRLSDNLNLVEQCLFAQTTAKADTIFQTVSNLHLLQSMVAQESGRVSKLRDHIASLRSVATSGRSQVLALQRRRANSSALQKTLDAVKRVGVAKAALDKLLASSDYTGAFAAIETMQVILDGELAGVHALRTLVRQLREMKDVIGGEMVDKFVRVATDQWDEAADKDAKLKHALTPLVRGLFRKGDLRDALSKLRTKMIELIKQTSMQVVAHYAPEGQGKLLHDVDTPTFVAFLRATFEGLQHVLNRADAVHSAVKGALQTPPGKTSTQQEREEVKDILNSSAGVVLKARDQAHSVVVRLLNFRNDVHVKLRLPDFKLIWDETMNFVATSGEPATELKATLTKQADDFLVALDEHLTSQLKSLLEAELWEPVVVPKEFQQLVQRVEAKQVLDVPSALDELTGPPTGTGETKKVVVGDRPFRTTMTSLMMIKFLVEYVRCALMFPVVAPRAAARLFDLCVMFHEQTKRLILGTEVKRNGRLNSIGAKHLALASQSLSVVDRFLPAIGAVLESTVPVQQTARVQEELGRVRELLQGHVNQINDTIAGLIGAELSQLTDLPTRVDWDARGAEGLDRPHQYMHDLCERIVKLHTVLSNHLFADDINDVFERVFRMCNERVPELFAKVNPKTPIGKTRVRMDIAHLLSTLGRLKVLHGPGNTLELWLVQRFGKPGGSAPAASAPAAQADSQPPQPPAPSE